MNPILPAIPPAPPVSMEPAYPEHIQQAVRTAALLELAWRAEAYRGALMDEYRLEIALRQHAQLVLEKYQHILAGWWWCAYLDIVTRAIVLEVQSTPDDPAFRDPRGFSHARRMGDWY